MSELGPDERRERSPDERSEIRDQPTSLNAGPGFRCAYPGYLLFSSPREAGEGDHAKHGGGGALSDGNCGNSEITLKGPSHRAPRGPPPRSARWDGSRENAILFTSPRRAGRGSRARAAVIASGAKQSRSVRRILGCLVAKFVFVVAGLDPATHAELHFSMDHRVKPGGDTSGQRE
jgi:hypothetical protein